MVYDAFRTNNFPTYYGSNKTPFLADVTEGGIAFCAVILFISFLCILPGIRGKERIFAFLRVAFIIFVLSVIAVCLFGQSWETGAITTSTQYKAGIPNILHKADIGLYIGLRGINITLKADGTQLTTRHNETINYNEHFSWVWRQGRAGFGQFAGRFNREFREAQRRGYPYPILWIAEYFTIDGEGIRWGRHYRLAGWYSHICLWFAFALFITAIILTFVLLRYAAYTLALCGASILTANIIFATLRNPNELQIPFPNDVIRLKYGWCFVLMLLTGILCIIIALVIFLLDWKRHDLLVTFFGVDALQDADDEVVIDVKSPENEPAPGTSENKTDESGEDISEPSFEVVAPAKYVRRVGQTFKSKRRKEAPPPRPRRAPNEVHENELFQEDYQNAHVLEQMERGQAGPPVPGGRRRKLH